MKKIFNLEYLVSILVFEKKQSQRFIWHTVEKTNWLGRVLRIDSGFTDINSVFSVKMLSNQQVEEEGYIVENNIAYKKPRVMLKFANQDDYTKVFNTDEEANEWAFQFEERLKDSYWYEDN
jgi:hypothetical protein